MIALVLPSIPSSTLAGYISDRRHGSRPVLIAGAVLLMAAVSLSFVWMVEYKAIAVTTVISGIVRIAFRAAVENCHRCGEQEP
jgi:MFS family permease